LNKIQSLNPDILFIYDDDALRHIGGKLLDTDLPIVFAGVNLLPTKPDYAWKKAYTDRFETLKELILGYQDKVDSIVLFIPWTLEDKDGNHVPQDQVVRWMLQNSKRPGIAYLDILAEEGYLCGVVVDMVKQGFHAGNLGSRILKGENPADMPVMDPVANRIMINLARARQLGIDIPFQIFEDADVILKEMTAFPDFIIEK
jgi:hypothetical protein